MKKHVWAIVLAMLLVIGLMPAALAEETQTTGLMFREMYWDENNEPALADELLSEWEASPGDETVVKFFYVTDENPDGVEVALEELTFSGVSAEYYQNTDFVYLLVEEFGECTVSYEADDGTHTLTINSVLPSFGFYSEPEVSEETYLSIFTLTEVGQTIYFAVGEGATVTTIEGGGFAAFADLTQISETCWQITFNGRPWFRDGYYGLPITGTDDGEYVEGGAMLRIVDKMPGLVFRYGFHDGENWVEDENDYFHGIMEEAVIAEPVVRFYFYDGEENYEPVPFEDLLGTERVRLYVETEELVRLSFTALGTHSVSYESDGETYYSTITVGLPEFGFYTEPYVSEETVIIRNFEVTAENNTIYFIVNNDPDNEYYNNGEITYLELMGHFAEIAEAQPYTDPEAGPVTCWEITINGRARSGEWYDVCYSGANPWGDPVEEYWEGLHLFDNSPVLVVRYADHDGENFFENEENPFDYEIHLATNHRPVVKFYLIDGENCIPVDPADLIPGEGVAINRIEDTDFVEIVASVWGWNSIGYEYEGTVYELPVYVRLPEIGFYYEPEASEETYINEFTVSSEGAVCYVVAIDDTTLTSVRLADEFNDVATIEQLDETCWKITFTGEPWDDHWYRIWCDGVNGGGEEFYDREESVFVRNTMPRLVYRDLPMDEEGNLYEDEEWGLNREWYGPINRSTFVRIYFFDGENYFPVDPDALTSSDAITIRRVDGTDYIEFVTNAWGDYSIDYEVDGESYSLPITVGLPTFGFYSTTEPSEETYLPELRITDVNDPVIFYLIANEGATIETVTPIYGFEDIAQVEQISDTCWQITVNGTIEDGRWYHVSFTGTEPWGDYIEYREEGIQLFDVAPRLVLRQLCEDENSLYEHPEWEWGLHRDEWSGPINCQLPIKLYFFDGENYIPVDFSDLTWDGSIELHAIEDTEFARIIPTGWGNGTIRYEHEDGNTYEFPIHIVLPTFGFYTTGEPSEDSYIWELKMSGDSAEAYFIAIDGATLNSVELIYGFEEIASVEQLSDTCWKIAVSGNYEDGGWYSIRYSGTEPWGDEFEPREDGLCIRLDENAPHLAFRDLAMDEEGNWYEDEEWGLNRGWYGPIGNHVNVRVYFFDGENYFPVDPDALTSPDAITINRIDGTDYIEFITNAWGDYSIDYEFDGVVYSLPITVGLPEFGFYSTTEPSEETYLPEFHVSDENNAFYFIATGGATLSRVTLHENFDEFADIDCISDTCYQITITGAFESDCGYGLTFDGIEGWGGIAENWEQYIHLVNDEIELEAPTVTVTLNDSDQPVITWNAVDGAEKYEVWRAVGDGEFKLLKTTTSKKLTNTSVEAGKTYSYKVRAVAGEEYSDYSDVVTITVPAALAAPTVTVTLNSSDKPVISWNAVDGAEKYEVWRAVDGGAFKLLKAVTGTKLTNTSVEAGKTYSYKVRAVAGEEYSDYSDVVTITVPAALAAPTVTVTLNSNDKPVISWTAVDGAEKYEIWRAVEGGEFKLLKTTTSKKLTNTSVEAGKTYSYKVRAIAGEDYSDYSDVVTVTIPAALGVPTVSVTLNSKDQPVISWTAVDGAEKYEIWRAVGSGEFKLLKTTTSKKLTNTSVEAGVTYRYKVRAIAGEEQGEFSTVKTITVPSALGTPTVTVSNKTSTGKVVVKWGKVEGAEKYEIWYSTSKSGTYTRLWIGSSTSVTHSSAKAGTIYYYKVRAVAGGEYGEFSEIKQRACDCARPTVTITLNSKGKPVISWKAVEGAVKYEIWCSTSENGTYTKLITTTKLKVTHSSSVSGTTYFYKVRAICSISSGNSAYSTVKSVTVE